jgi:osmotically-inducible protein OsmY
LVAAGLGLALGACAPAAVDTGAAARVTAAREPGFKGAMSDTEIRLEINHLWFQESASLYGQVNLQVQEGRVLLTGNVPDPEARLSAVRLAWQAKGVVEAINEIEVRDTSSLLDAARDDWISAELEARILVDLAIVSINYSIGTVNQVVYLIGVARSRAELDRVIAHARDIAYVRRVIDYVRLKDDPARAS